MIVGYLLKRYRNERGLSQRALGRLANVRWALISELENGKKPDTLLGTAERIAAALGVSLEKLLRDDVEDPRAAPASTVPGRLLLAEGNNTLMERIVCTV